jgi:hypothetical protein
MKIPDVDNVEIYKPIKSQFKNRCILGYKKKTNLTNFQVLKMGTVHLAQIYTFVFLVEPQIKRIWT